jgi:hypothetical protein
MTQPLHPNRVGAAVGIGVLLFVGSARAGGNPGQIVAVGATHESRVLSLTAAQGELLYQGRVASAPRAGYVRIYPIFYGLPGAPARLFPAAGILCFDPPPATKCRRLPASMRAALAPLRRLPLRLEPPNRVQSLFVGAKQLRLPNVRTAVELAFDRGGRSVASPAGSLTLRIAWRGPGSSSLPRSARLVTNGLYAAGRLYPLSPGVAAYVKHNLP